MDAFEFNKLAGAVLGTALGVMALSIVSDIIYAPAEAEQPGYVIALAETGGEAATTAAGTPEVTPISERLQSADAAAGQSKAKVCLACHTFEQGGAGKVGPNLYGVVGGPAAHMEGFKYSQALLDKRDEGLTWTFDNLDHFLAAPKSFVPGTAMAFVGLKKPDERADVIDYLRTLSDNPVPLPATTAATETPAAGPAMGEPAAGMPAEEPAPQHSTELPPPAPDTAQ